MPRRTGEAATRIAVILSLALVPALAVADEGVRFEATVDRSAITLDDWITLTVTLTTSGGSAASIELPRAPDFEIRSRGQSEQSAFQFGARGAVRTHTRIHTLVMRPLREGLLTIHPGRAVVGGKTYETAPIQVRVGPGAAPPRPERDAEVAAARPRGDVFVEAHVDKTRAYVGEEILLSVWLYARVDVSHVSSLDLPDLDGFWIGEIANPTQLSARMQEVGGVPYRVYLLSRKALFGLREGKLEIAPATVDLTVGGGFFGRGRSLRRSSPPVEVEILPLPPSGEALPLGAVGDFVLRAEAAPRSVRVGEPITYRLTAAGRGNLSGIDFPSLPEIEGLRAFEPTHGEQVDVSSGRYGGSRTLEVVLIPERPGRFEIPSLPWLVFDPAAGAYRRLETEAFTIEVRGERIGGQTLDLGAAPVLPLREPVRLDVPRAFWRAPWFAAALAVPGLALLAAFVAPRLRRRLGTRGRDAGREALAQLARHGGGADWPEGIPRILHAYLEARLARPTAGLERRELAAHLVREGAPAELVRSLEALLEACERERFAPEALRSAPDGMWERARRWVEEFERTRRER